MKSARTKSLRAWRGLTGVGPSKKSASYRPLFELCESRVLLSSYFVSANGSDSAAGSANAPWKTLQHAADLVHAGDVVDVAAGTYAGFELGWEFPVNGTAGNPITFHAEPGAIINSANYKSADGIDLEGSNYITIDGFTVTNGGTLTRAGIRAVGNPGANSIGVIIENNNCSGCGDWDIFTAFTTNAQILNNSASDSLTQHGIYVSNSAVNPHVIGNTVFDNLDCGIHLNGDASQGGTGIITGALIEGNIIYNNGVGGGSAIDCDGVQNSVIENNLLYGNHASGISLFQIDAAQPAKNNIVTSNTIVEAADARWCINIVNGSTGNTVYNNILDNLNPAHGAINIDTASLTGFTSDYNAIINNRFTPNDGDSNMTLAQWQSATSQDHHSVVVASAAALFVDAANNNYHILSSSAAVDAGTSVDAPTTDLAGNPRPGGSGFDIGSYEIQSTPTKTATATTLATSSNSSNAGQTVTFTATVTGTGGTPTGTVTFKDGSTIVGTGNLSGGVATLSLANLPIGTDAITAVYSGDSNFLASTSSTLNETVSLDPSTTTLAASANSSNAGQTVTITATVTGTGGTPTGTVTFKDGSTVVGTGNLSGGVATLSLANLPIGTDAITAVYSGDSNFLASTSSTLNETVTLDPSTTTLAASANSSNAGQTVTFTATVSGIVGTPTGSITFKDGTTVLGTQSLSGGLASIAISNLAVGTHTVTAVYSGDNNFLASTSSALAFVVNANSTVTALRASPLDSVLQQNVTFTAAISGSNGTPAGTVTFEEGSTVLGSGQVIAGNATFTTATLALGAHTITAIYNGNANFLASTSAAVIEQVVQASTAVPTTIAETVDNISAVFGQTVTFTAAVSGGNAGVPTGIVTFMDGNTVMGAGSLDDSGQAVLVVSNLAVGSHSITAMYGGDANFNGSTSNTQSETVSTMSTTATLSSSANSAAPGQTITFTILVSSSGSGTPTGVVTFIDGSSLLGTGNLDNSGQAVLAISNLAIGTHSITAVYSGDANFNGSTSNTQSETVSIMSTTATLSSSADSAAPGQTITFTILVSSSGSGTPTGVVTFIDGSSLLGTGNLDNSGQAVLAISNLAIGTHSITAVYSGDANFNGSTSNTQSETVSIMSTTATLSSSADSAAPGQTITFTALVSSSGSGTPTGVVTFMDGSSLLGTGNLDNSGQAILAISNLAIGTHSITAVYSGDANFNGSNSNTQSEVVSMESTTTVITSTGDATDFNSTATLTATVSSNAANPGTPTGTVTFMDGSTTLGTATLDGSGNAVLVLATPLNLGGHTLSVIYGGDGQCTGSTSAVDAIITGTTHEIYVNHLYLDLLHRAADTAGLEGWAGAMDAGESATAVASALTGSVEYDSQVVDGFYESYLGRHAEAGPTGIGYWVNLIQGGLSPDTIRNTIISSDEYFARNGGTNESFVTTLYQTFLHRAPDAGGFAAWTGNLNSGGMTRGQVVAMFTNSAESRSDVVTGLYQNLLNRNPASNELDYWSEQLNSGMQESQIAVVFVTSSEYMNLIGLA